jgi:hypothetical protein
MKNLKDLIDSRNYDQPKSEIFWCPFCGCLQDLNAVDCSVNTPMYHRISVVRERYQN